MLRLITKNLGWKLLSIAGAFVLWLAVAREPELATSVSVPVEFKNIPDDLDISSDVPDRIHIEIRGPAGRLSRDYLADLAALLDMGDARPGERTFTVHAWNINLPAGVEFYRAVPSQLTLRFDRLITRNIEVEPRYANSPPEGYTIAAARIDPPTVRIRGPEDHVRRIDRVRTDPLDLSSAVGRMDFQAQVNLGDPQVRLESSPAITVHLTLQRLGLNDRK